MKIQITYNIVVQHDIQYGIDILGEAHQIKIV